MQIIQYYTGCFPRVKSIKELAEDGMIVDYCGFSEEKGEEVLERLKNRYVIIHSNGWENTFIDVEPRIDWFSEPKKQIIKEICLQQGIDPKRFPNFFMKYREYLTKSKETQEEILGFIRDETKELLSELRLDSPPKVGYWIAFID